MCAIAGIIDLVDHRPVPPEAIRAMADLLSHRGPDEDGFLERPGMALASRRLSIVGLADGCQPLTNEDRTIFVVFNGELFDYPEMRAALEGRGHQFVTHCDTEVLPHLWEEEHEAMFEQLRGQFALALWDQRQQRMLLGRDRFGICPLYWARQDGWLLFASEIKALFASGLVKARPDLRGLDQTFTFFSLPGPVTCFAGVSALLPGHYLDVRLPAAGQGKPAQVRDVRYWEVSFPDRGDEDPGGDVKSLVDGFEAVLTRAVERRLRADVPVVSYLSGGVDSSIVVALARHLRGQPIPMFTIKIDAPSLDETGPAGVVARHVGAEPVVTTCGPAEIVGAYRELIEAAECPVIDTSCAALLLQAREVHQRGYKVALTGEGSDEWLAGYPWYKVNRLLGWLDVIPGLPLGRLGRRAFLWLAGPRGFRWPHFKRFEKGFGDHAWMDMYALMSMSKCRLFSRHMTDLLAGYQPHADLELNLEGMRRWHPLNRGLYVGARVMLPGLLLSAKGDRVAMHSAVETRYPFLDEDVFAFMARLHPRWKLRGLRDKYLLRLVAERWLPPDIAWRRKGIFRAPFESLFCLRPPAFVDQLLSEPSLRRTGYFDIEAVRHWRQAADTMAVPLGQRTFLRMGLAGVVATQLWHHLFIDGSLAELPSPAPLARPALAVS
ncbi:MAG TPA: asparagine synthase (glutamine-hydrolyzing) [Gemmataceae bacterium]|jgi:asparagine synthase (glutamine-hydrolysing)|nr:asparagine synthase (glutamine-hydrolyzing) [Gemmataceae bacterium]